MARMGLELNERKCSDGVCPQVVVEGRRVLDVSGAPGAAYRPEAEPGTDGLPGRPGGPGGSVLVVAQGVANAAGLRVVADGGRGGNGQKGGRGSAGADTSNGLLFNDGPNDSKGGNIAFSVLTLGLWAAGDAIRSCKVYPPDVLCKSAPEWDGDHAFACWVDEMAIKQSSAKLPGKNRQELQNLQLWGGVGGRGADGGVGGLPGRGGSVAILAPGAAGVAVSTADGRPGQAGPGGDGGLGGSNRKMQKWSFDCLQNRGWETHLRDRRSRGLSDSGPKGQPGASRAGCATCLAPTKAVPLRAGWPARALALYRDAVLAHYKVRVYTLLKSFVLGDAQQISPIFLRNVY